VSSVDRHDPKALPSRVLDGKVAQAADAENGDRSPAPAPECRNALNVVTPAQRSGADCTELSAAGTLANAEASASMCVA
jgi:hypothetical protein